MADDTLSPAEEERERQKAGAHLLVFHMGALRTFIAGAEQMLAQGVSTHTAGALLKDLRQRINEFERWLDAQ
jgi:hypothetical protein